MPVSRTLIASTEELVMWLHWCAYVKLGTLVQPVEQVRFLQTSSLLSHVPHLIRLPKKSHRVNWVQWPLLFHFYNKLTNKLYSKNDSIFHNCKIVNHATVSKKTRRLITVKSTSGPIAIQTPCYRKGSLPPWLYIISISQEMGRLLLELKIRTEDLDLL